MNMHFTFPPIRFTFVLLAYLLFLNTLIVDAQWTEKVYLSGTGFDNTKEWDFYCSDGKNSGAWSTIQVPSCWEQEGYGQYTYGHFPLDQRLKEEGHYRYFFDVEKEWKGQNVRIVFEGVMTDAKVVINGKQAGEVHQGGFYQFSYDISKLVKYGKENTLEVFVKKFSDNLSVTQAERKADYWVFGGVYRPVFLEIKPQEHIQRVAIDARASGAFNSEIYILAEKSATQIEVKILDQAGNPAFSLKSSVPENAELVKLSGTATDPILWNPEFPTSIQLHSICSMKRAQSYTALVRR